MIKTFIDGYVVFEWEDGNTYCLTVDVYNVFAEMHNLPKV